MNLISSVMPLVSPGYFFLYLFLLLITGGALPVLVETDNEGDQDEEAEVVESKQQRTRTRWLCLTLVVDEIVKGLIDWGGKTLYDIGGIEILGGIVCRTTISLFSISLRYHLISSR